MILRFNLSRKSPALVNHQTCYMFVYLCVSYLCLCVCVCFRSVVRAARCSEADVGSGALRQS